MKNFYCSVSLPFSLNLDLRKFVNQQTRCQPELLPAEMHQWIKKNIDAIVLWTEVFYLPPYQIYDIHCDGHEIDNKCKLNYIVNGQNSTMIWYKALDESSIISAYSKSNTKYLKLEKNNATEICRATLTEFNLVNVGDFHTVINGENHRWCISIVVGDIESKERLNYDEVKLRLNMI